MDSVSETFRKGVCAVVVTHNRLACLKRTLGALRGFGVATVVVDNASNDGTGAWLREVGAETLTLPRNVGGSGGFAAGMRWAITRGFDWLWLMDDDVEPLPGALAAYARHAAPGACLTPSKLTATGAVFEFEGRLCWRTLRRRRLPHARVFAGGREAVPCELACFEGLFVDARLAAGLIAPWERFFLGWDDMLFGMLASKAGRCLYIRDFCVRKQFDKERPLVGRLRYHSSLLGRYFHLRNFCFVIRLVRTRGWGGGLAWARYAYEWAKACALTVLAERDWRGVRLLALAWWHGVRGDTESAFGLVVPGE